MAIDKLNFSGINSGSGSLTTPIGSLSDRLMKYGSILNQNAIDEAKQKMLEDENAYQKQKDATSNTRYEADKREKLEDKNRLLQKDYNTANAMSAIENKDDYIAGRLQSEQKAIQDTLSSATPEDRFRMQQELKGYDSKVSGKQWADTALSQSNVDSNMIGNLKRDIVKQKADEAYKQDSLALQRRQNEIAAGARADQRSLDDRKLKLEENKLKAPSKEDIKAAETLKGLYARYKDVGMKPNPSLTNDQLEDVLKEKLKEAKELKDAKNKLIESGNFLETPKESVQAQRNKFLRDSLAGANGTTFKSVEDEIKNDQDKIDRFLLNAKIKLGKENYSDKQVLSMIANERKNQSISAPWDNGMQDALETVAEQLGISEQDF